MMEDPLKSQQPRQEKLDTTTRIATPKDLEACLSLRLEGLKNYPYMLGVTKEGINEEESKIELKEELLPHKNKFYILAEKGSVPVGISFAIRAKGDWWHVGRDYTKTEFMNQGIGKKMLARRLYEILQKGGATVTAFIRPDNDTNIHIYTSFGFQEVDIMSTQYSKETKADVKETGFLCFELDLTDPDVIRRVDKVLNAG